MSVNEVCTLFAFKNNLVFTKHTRYQRVSTTLPPQYKHNCIYMWNSFAEAFKKTKTSAQHKITKMTCIDPISINWRSTLETTTSPETIYRFLSLHSVFLHCSQKLWIKKLLTLQGTQLKFTKPPKRTTSVPQLLCPYGKLLCWLGYSRMQLQYWVRALLLLSWAVDSASLYLFSIKCKHEADLLLLKLLNFAT